MHPLRPGNQTWRKCRKPILVAATFAYKDRETLNLIEIHELQRWLFITLQGRVQSKSLWLTEYIEKCLHKSENYPIQKRHRCTR